MQSVSMPFAQPPSVATVFSAAQLQETLGEHIPWGTPPQEATVESCNGPVSVQEVPIILVTETGSYAPNTRLELVAQLPVIFEKEERVHPIYGNMPHIQPRTNSPVVVFRIPITTFQIPMQRPTWARVAYRWLQHVNTYTANGYTFPYFHAQLAVLEEMFQWLVLPENEITHHLKILGEISLPKKVEFN